MLYTFTDPTLAGFFSFSAHIAQDWDHLQQQEGLIHLLWNRSEVAIPLELDGVRTKVPPNHLVSLTYFHRFAFVAPTQDLAAFSFNREFYCIQTHDAEVSCNGILFFGAQRPRLIALEEDEQHSFELLRQVFEEEFRTRDNIQGEMLRMLLKRLIIKSTRLAREQYLPQVAEPTQLDLIRKYQVLVDLHFREKKQVSEYADLLFKSPKTLSNVFAKNDQPSPLRLIHERISLEGRRLLHYTDKTAKEIAFELGFEDAGSFFKLFKKLNGQTPLQFRESQT
ncbi:MAG: helix-turn-helix domain-containing protein [Bacteroidota bacterium]